MTKNPTPEAWIGDLVAVTLDVRTPEEFVARLDEVNDRGLVLTIAPESENPPVTFYPWSAIRRLRQQTGGDFSSQRKARPGNRSPGDPGWFS